LDYFANSYALSIDLSGCFIAENQFVNPRGTVIRIGGLYTTLTMRALPRRHIPVAIIASDDPPALLSSAEGIVGKADSTAILTLSLLLYAVWSSSAEQPASPRATITV